MTASSQGKRTSAANDLSRSPTEERLIGAGKAEGAEEAGRADAVVVEGHRAVRGANADAGAFLEDRAQVLRRRRRDRLRPGLRLAPTHAHGGARERPRERECERASSPLYSHHLIIRIGLRTRRPPNLSGAASARRRDADLLLALLLGAAL